MKRTTIRRATLATVTAGVALTVSATPALAHECYVANRSAQGNAGASHSANWYTLTLDELFSSAHHFLPVEPFTAEQKQQALAMAAAQGIPSSFTVFEPFTLPASLTEETVTAKSSDGKGIDHFFVKYGDQLVQIVFTVGTPTTAS